MESLACDVIGTGPRLQLTIPDAPVNYARQIERTWGQQWVMDPTVDFADKLRLMEEAEVTDGESFGLFFTNPAVEHDVKLDVRVIECEMCADPWTVVPLPGQTDGIVRDEFKNPIGYRILREHPGDVPFFTANSNFDTWPARLVMHWFKPSRAGEGRGFSGLASALDRFAQIRRYEKSVLTAAETAAVLSAIMKTNMLPDAIGDDNGPDAPTTYDRVPLDPGTMITLPDGWDATQMKAEQPVAQYPEFKGDQIDAAGRAVNAPSNVARGHSREYNFASGRLDYAIWHRCVRIRRRRLRIRVLDRAFKAWIVEAAAIPRYLPSSLPPISSWTWTWHWDKFESIDPQKDASASMTKLQFGGLTYAEYWAEEGKDWEEQFDQIGREMALAKAKGFVLAYGAGPQMAFPSAAGAAPGSTTSTTPPPVPSPTAEPTEEADPPEEVYDEEQ